MVEGGERSLNMDRKRRRERRKVGSKQQGRRVKGIQGVLKSLEKKWKQRRRRMCPVTREEVEAKGKDGEGNTRCAQVTREEVEAKGKEGEENTRCAQVTREEVGAKEKEDVLNP